MNKSRSELSPRGHIRGGAKTPHYKKTAEMPSATLPAPAEVTIAMQQHIGASLLPVVKGGDAVFVGTVVGDSEAFVSAPVHSSVSGIVKAIGTMQLPSGAQCATVVITSDGTMTPDPSIQPLVVETEADLVAAARNSGLVGLGGAGFPAHVKLTRHPKKELDTLIINGAECEPYITSDYRECIENANDIMQGIYLVKRLLQIKNVIIAVEDNKPEAIKILGEIAEDKQDTDDSVKLLKLKSRYPQGAEKVLIYTATGRKLPMGKLPADVGCIVMNITSISFLNKYIKTGMPLVTKRITVDGSAVENPNNLIVPIGTPIDEILAFCGLKEEPTKILMGGPMMGLALCDTSVPILKQNNAILAFDSKEATEFESTACIRCGRCMKACPMQLMPASVEIAMKSPDVEALSGLYADYCIECGSCAYSCPARRPLVQVMRLAKSELKKGGKH